jgi:hypothetical protein
MTVFTSVPEQLVTRETGCHKNEAFVLKAALRDFAHAYFT